MKCLCVLQAGCSLTMPAQQITRSMPDAVWVRIFQLIQDADPVFSHWRNFNIDAERQANLHGLRLVCAWSAKSSVTSSSAIQT